MATTSYTELEVAHRWLEDGRSVAIATVIDAWRSAPRRVGSQMVIDDHDRFEGSVSGGCVETSVLQIARRVLASGRSEAVTFGVTQEQAWEVGLPCGGQIEVFVAMADRRVVHDLVRAHERRETRFLWLDIQSGASLLLPPSLDPGTLATLWDTPLPVLAAIAEERSSTFAAASRRAFLHCFGASWRLVIVGAVHLSQVLTNLAQRAGFEVSIVDPRTVFATAERFPNTRIVHMWPERALSELGLDRRTAVAVLSHDAKLDDPALASALRSPSFYIGALGSMRTQQARRERLLEQGFSSDDVTRLHGPIGLDIGAVEAEEIAVAILAEIIQARRSSELRRA